MLDKMQYALRDMQITRALLEIKNSSFFERSISRLIAIRLDFIRYAREVNNDITDGRLSKERRAMKDHLNALDDAYTVRSFFRKMERKLPFLT